MKVDISPGKATNRVTFDKEGMVKYFCEFHGDAMKGTINVKKAP
jgi:plastocyanin